MKNRLCWKITTFAMVFVLISFTVASAQRGGGRGGRGGGGARPNFGGGGGHFGSGSVTHRSITPSPGMSRPNIRPQVPSHVRPTPSKRPTLPNIPDRPSFKPMETGRNLPHPAGHMQPKPVGGHRPDAGLRDGPDWKHWKNFDTSKIHESVVNKTHVDRKTADKVRDRFHDRFADKKFGADDWFKRHPDSWHPGHGPHPPGPRPPHPGPHPHPHPHPGPPPPPHFWWHRPAWDHTWAWFAAGFFTGAVVDNTIQPVVYDYGSNIVYEGETVYINGIPYVGADEYYQQAMDLAEAEPEASEAAAVTTTADAPEASNDAKDAPGVEGDWLSMGTFAIVADGKEEQAKRIVQLATNKDGQIRGNLIAPETDESTQLYGNVDPKTQRVAFKVEGHDEVVAECGLWNLTQDTVPLLVHVNKDRTEERTLVRLNEKTEQGDEQEENRSE